MTSIIQSLPATDEPDDTLINKVCVKRHMHKCKHVLKSKENSLRHKCNKALKRKLKQYKLRPDGIEDKDILDVSDILVNSLTIQSPENKKYQLVKENLLSERPKNYLFRMVRNKQSKNINGKSGNTTFSSENDFDCSGGSQQKKQTNAFKLLMDSRNKTIGSNSPGKDKTVEENLCQEIIEKKNSKAKRILVLQKMSEAKGALKKRELEESQDEYIQVEMKKRADKFKSMLLNQQPTSHEMKQTSDKHKGKNLSKVANNNDTVKLKIEPKKKSLQLISLFNDAQIDYDKNIVSKNKEIFSKEDKEFLEKLSPSIKKKENMLCYFMKIEKEAEPSNDDVVIKVKLPANINRKIKNKKKQTELNGELSNENCKQNVTDPSTDLPEKPISRPKRKRNFALPKQDIATETIDILEDTSNRPKRNIKKPVKYNDDILLSSSDEELHIFTPKKKKQTISGTVSQNFKPINDIKDAECTKKYKKNEMPLSLLKNNVKLAPIFNTKQKPDAVSLEAKQKFLQSGVPEQLKKIIALQKHLPTEENFFPIVVHIQQKTCFNEVIKYPSINIPLLNFDNETNNNFQHQSNLFTKLLDLSCLKPQEDLCSSQPHIDINELLQHMKQIRPRFPVYRTYRLLRDKRKGEFRGPNYLDLDNSVEVNNSVLDVSENPDQLNWTDKYKAMSTNQIIGNFETVKELKKWLVLWTENQQKSKNNVQANSDSSDFYNSDTDGQDSVRNINNLLIITGPTGSGKTSSVYAVAADLAIKVIEVNASNKRTGKIILQDLQEATQSHKVNRGASNTDNALKSQEICEVETSKTRKNRGRPKKNIIKSSKKIKKESKQEVQNSLSGSQDVARTHTSLILIDDADIMFDQDEGFCSAIAQLVQSSKRPVILVTSSLSCPHLQRFLLNGKILKMNPLSPKILGTWLDIMCLADSGTCCLGAGAKFLNYFNGDVRKTINCLQFYVSSQSQSLVTDEISSQAYYDMNKLNIDDEKSNISWVDQEDNEVKNIVPSDVIKKETEYLWDNYVQSQLRLNHIKFPVNTFNIWWSLPQALNLEEEKANSVRLESIANVMDSMSVSDFYSFITPNDRINITSDPWITSEDHSMSECEDMKYYRRNVEVCDAISYELIQNSIIQSQSISKNNNNFDVDFPGMTVQRERDRVVSRHNNLSSYLNPSACMDRRALALDYWTACRTICRIEKTKSDSYTKRNNRFCHYLKSLNILCKNESFDYLCDSLSLVKKH